MAAVVLAEAVAAGAAVTGAVVVAVAGAAAVAASVAAALRGTGDGMNWINKYFSETDLKDIETCVLDAETKTSGEIVPVFIFQSGSYGHVYPLLAAFLLTMVLTLDISGVLAFHLTMGTWLPILEVVVVFGLAWVLAKNRKTKRWLTAPRDRNQQASLRAEIEFHRQRIGTTENATGIMLFLSFTEHFAMVLADKSIAEKCPPEIWREVVASMTEGMRKSTPADGIKQAIKKCGDVLAHHFPVSHRDRNELPNKMVIKEY